MSGAVDHDVVVIGAGHNGLVCAAYLARAGLDVLVLEARATVGGLASTVDALGGAKVNICNCDHLLVRANGIVEELDLASQGLRYLDLDPVQLALPRGGEAAWMLFSDQERTLQSLALTHPEQVAGYRRYLDDLMPAARLVLELSRDPPSPRAVAKRVAGSRSRAAAKLLWLTRVSAAAVLRRYFSSDALLGPAALAGPAVWGLPPQAPGTGLGALGYALRHIAKVGRPVGGSGALTDALAAALRAAGGEVRTGARVAAITCGDVRADGVRLEDGTHISARAVVSAADPRTTLTTLLEDPPPGAAKLVERWRSRLEPQGYESKLDAVVANLPRPRGIDPDDLAKLGVADPLHATLVVAPGLDKIATAHASAELGSVASDPLFLANVPSLLDPTVAPPDGHLFSLEVLFTPYKLAGGWSTSDEPERWLRSFATLLEPGFLDAIKRWRLVGPGDYERDFALPKGHPAAFQSGPLAALAGRGRNRELTRYETALPGLYLTGSGTFPGAGISGAPGRNAAHVVAARLTER